MINRIVEITLILICVALWVILIRTSFNPSSASGPAPIIMSPQTELPYMIVENGHISVWYVDAPGPKHSRPNESVDDMTEDIMKNTKLIRVDSQSLH